MNEGFSSWVGVLVCAMVLGGCRGSAEPESGEVRQAEAAPATGAEAPDEGTVPAGARGPADHVPTIIQPDPSWPTPPEGMIYIPAADVWLGEEGDDVNPRRLVHMEAFFIDRTEVTAGAFEGCVASARCPAYTRPPALQLTDPPDSPVARWIVEQCTFGRPDRRDHPMNCVSRVQATLYCISQTGRLARADEWEYAARGTDERRYPWGSENAHDRAYGNSCDESLRARFASIGANSATLEQWYEPFDDGFPATAPVGAFVGDTTPFGLRDTSGNVSEWTGDAGRLPETGADSDEVPLRLGGSWIVGTMPSAYRNFYEELRQHPAVGFRCVQDVSSATGSELRETRSTP
jgi:formylglycine-generating enzyme required for sulfatase activity